MHSGPDYKVLQRLLADWSTIWNLPDLESRLSIVFSPRFRTAVGRCAPDKSEIRLASFLLTAPPEVLREALCHEAAHAAVYALHGRGPRPHGEEWRELMRAAGFEPRIRMPVDMSPHGRKSRKGNRGLWEHRCPICHMSRTAHRPVRNWRCAQCRAAGLAGDLIVTRIDGAARGSQ